MTLEQKDIFYSIRKEMKDALGWTNLTEDDMAEFEKIIQKVEDEYKSHENN